MNHTEIATELKQCPENIVLIYAFNATGKTRLSVAYKDLTKNDENGHTGVYYNAYSEDLFVWDNDEENGGANKTLTVIPSSLNRLHSLLTEDAIKEKLRAYNPSYNFYFRSNVDTTDIRSIDFYKDGDEEIPIKISRGEERIFIWCFFLALFEVEGWADIQNEHFFIDDPVSSLDDHNIFITASLISDFIVHHFGNRKIIFTTHHLGIFSLLSDFLRKGENVGRFRNDDKEKTPKFRTLILERKGDDLRLKNSSKAVMLYHLRLLQLLEEAKDDEQHYLYHFAWLRQVLENVSSFLGKGNVSYALAQIGITDANRVTDIINALSHKKVYGYQSALMSADDETMFKEVLKGLMDKYKFKLHA